LVSAAIVRSVCRSSQRQRSIDARGTSLATADVVNDERDAEHDRRETLSVVTTSLAAVLTAWSAFQAATWSGRQTFALALAEKKRQLSAQARLEGDQQRHLDANLFVAWSSAHVEHHDELATFLYGRFPPRLKKAMDVWLSTHPFESQDAPAHPFVMKEYELDAHERAESLGKEADAAVEKAETANLHSDTYVLGTVVFATIILLASLGPRLRRPRSQRLMLVVSGMVLLLAIAWLSELPIAWLGA